LKLAFDALGARDYTHAFSLFNESVEQGLSTNELHPLDLNMRGTFR
jgi:import receptor subunit TOM70